MSIYAAGRTLLYSTSENDLYTREFDDPYSKVPYPFRPQKEPLETSEDEAKKLKDILDADDKLNGTDDQLDGKSDDKVETTGKGKLENDQFHDGAWPTEVTVEIKQNGSIKSIENGSALQMGEKQTDSQSIKRNDL